MKVAYLHQFMYPDLPEDFAQRYPESVVTNPYFELVDPESMRSTFRNGLDELMHAARAGFDAVAVTEHGGNLYDVSPNPNLTAAAVAFATESEGLEVAIHVIGRTLGKTREPLRVAEEYAVLDHISGGRLMAGFPVGLAYDANYNYGVVPVETRSRYSENLELILRAWTERERFPWNGKYSQYPGVNIWPRPYQSPHPPVSISSIGTPNTARFALERDLGFNLVGAVGDPIKVTKPNYDQFWRMAAELGVDDNPYRATFTAFVIVADSDAEAERLYGRHAEYHFANGLGHIPMYRLAMPGSIPPVGLKQMMSAPAMLPDGPMTYKALVESGIVVAGSPATVRERLELVARTLRAGNVSVHLTLGSTPNDLARRSIDLFAEQVLPHLRTVWSEYDDANRWWPVRLGGKPPSAKQAATAGAVN